MNALCAHTATVSTSSPSELEKALQAITDNQKRLVAVVVHLNDTYLIDDRPERALPGFARITATVKRLREHVNEVVGADRVLVVHSGDFLGPSRLSLQDHGEAMVELLNLAGVEYCVLGNHEFDDYGKLLGAQVLADRLREAKFKVLLSNASDPTGLINVDSGAFWPAPDGPDSKPLISLTGVVSADVANSFQSPYEDPDPFADDVIKKWDFIPPSQALIRFLQIQPDVPFRIVLSHATQSEDRLLRLQIPETPRTYVLGGHDHDIEWVEDDRQVFVMKNLSNAETVRVLLLLAGGDSVTRKVYATYQRLAQRRRNTGGQKPSYPQDLEAVLLAANDLDSDVIREHIANEAPTGEFDNLDDALFSACYKRDIIAYKLRYNDHPAPDPQAAATIQKAIDGLVGAADDGQLVRDFSPVKLEARDARIRRYQTNFGAFVAECVRLQADDADVAIINSGSFRCDCVLGSKLRMRDLREAFLYDKPNAIMVLEVDSKVVDALIHHGRQPAKLGTGAFPQIADHREGKTGLVRLAISSYLLTKPNNTDGYDVVLFKEWAQKAWQSPDLATARIDAEKASAGSPKFSIIDAVRNKASVAEFSLPAVPPAPNTERIIELLKAYADTFFDEMSPHATTNASYELFRTWLGTDGPPPATNPKIEEARKAVRDFLRELPAVAACVARTPGCSVYAAQDELEALQSSLAGNDAYFRDGADYVWMFDLAARGIPGWWPQRPD